MTHKTTLSRRSSRMLGVAALAFVAALGSAFLPGAPTASADTCHKVWKFKVCGAALNASKLGTTMYAGAIVPKGGTACTVYDPASSKPHNGHKLRCDSRSVAPGKLASHRDTDVITFKRDFTFNDKRYKANQWVKIRIAAVCVDPLVVVCYGI